jgi:hypothetical protein
LSLIKQESWFLKDRIFLLSPCQGDIRMFVENARIPNLRFLTYQSDSGSGEEKTMKFLLWHRTIGYCEL